MSKIKQIKSKIIECMKSNEDETRDILKTLLGELQAQATKEGVTDIPDSIVESTVKSFKKNAEECLSVKDDDKTKREIAIYKDMLPTYETVDQIIERLANHTETLKNAKAVGPATGMAKGILNKLDCKVQGKDIYTAVEIIRGE